MRNFVRFICLVMVLSLSVASIASAAVYSARYSDNLLQRSSTVKRVVKNLQADLSKNTSFSLVHDGIYGSQTYKAVEDFQRKHGLVIDGKAGKNTKTKIWPLRDKKYSY